jgi:hypothetical protein
MFSDKTQRINIKTVDQDDKLMTSVSCVVTDPRGEAQAITNNPGTVLITTRGHGDLRINCRKDGFTQTSTEGGSSFNSVALVNLLFWPGFLVDAATGSFKSYPSHFVVNMKKD